MPGTSMRRSPSGTILLRSRERFKAKGKSPDQLLNTSPAQISQKLDHTTPAGSELPTHRSRHGYTKAILAHHPRSSASASSGQQPTSHFLSLARHTPPRASLIRRLLRTAHRKACADAVSRQDWRCCGSRQTGSRQGSREGRRLGRRHQPMHSDDRNPQMSLTHQPSACLANLPGATRRARWRFLVRGERRGGSLSID